MKRLNLIKHDRSELVLLLLLAAVLLLNVVILRKVSLSVLDGDTSADMLLSYTLYEKGSWITDDYFYAAEPQFMLPIFFKPFFHLFEGWDLVRFCGSFCMEAFYLLSFIFLMSQSGVRRKTIWLGCILIMLPLNVAYGRSVLFHNYYIIQAALSFLSLGFLFILMRFGKDSRPTSDLILPSLILFLCMAVGCLKGIRVFVSTAIPVVLTAVIWVFRRSVTAHKHLTPKDLYPYWLLAVVLLVFGGLFGLVFSKQFILPKFGSMNLLDQKLTVPSLDKMRNILQGFMTQMGFRVNVPLMSLAGVLSIVGLAVGIWLLIYAFYRLWNDTSDTPVKAFLCGMFAVQMLVTLAVFFVSETPFQAGIDYSRYLVLASLWMVPCACIEADENESCPWWAPRRLAAWLSLFVLFLNGLYNGCYYISPYRFPQEYDGLAYDDISMGKKLQNVKNYIQVHEYTLGYALPDVANPLCELMNGFPMIPLTMEPDRLYYDDWNTLRSIRDLRPEKAFLVLPKEKQNVFESMEISNSAELLYFDDDGILLYEFSDADLFREYLRSQTNTYQKVR